MALERHLLALIGRRNPAVFDVLGGGGIASLNPQPLPPIAENVLDTVALNPQPLPPIEVGARAAADLLQLQSFATRLSVDVNRQADWVDDICPTWPKPPKLPPHVGPVPPDPPPEWLRAYHLGLASALAAADDSLRNTSLIEDVLGRSSAALEQGLG